MVRLARHPDLMLCWTDEGFLIRNLETRISIVGGTGLVEILGVFDPPCSAGVAAKRLAREDAASVAQAIRHLKRVGFLLPAGEARRKRRRIAVWKNNLAAAQYHVASSDLRYLTRPEEIRKYVKERVLVTARPPRFKSNSRGISLPLSQAAPQRSPAKELDFVLRSRRTVRTFRTRPVAFEDLARIVSMTWGARGEIKDPWLGVSIVKTSPSAGAIHPIEAYVLAWNVAGLLPGLYHYDVAGDALKRLRKGDFRDHAVEAASGQRWVARAAFLCVMTAMYTRTLWKYQLENGYRMVWLDAGHLAQTFCLVATSLGLGPFTTAAIQDTKIDRMLGIDGIEEFPVYLCGAGVPAPASDRSSKAAPAFHL